MKYIWWPHRCKRRLNHFLYRDSCDFSTAPNRPSMADGDQVVFCIMRAGLHLVWARAKLKGMSFQLPRSEVWDSEFDWAVPLRPNSVRWRHPPSSARIFSEWWALRAISQDEFSELVSEQNCKWLDYPWLEKSPIDDWRSWRCPSSVVYSSCTCKVRLYEEPPGASGARIGDSVTITDLRSNQLFTYILVVPGRADPQSGRLSVDSPMGKALHWRQEGEVVQVQAPGGTAQYRIEQIERPVY